MTSEEPKEAAEGANDDKKEVYDGVVTGKYQWGDAAKPSVEISMGSAITKYGWSDGKKKVDIYVELPDIDAVKDEDLVIENDKSSVKLTIKAIGTPPKCRVLSIPGLSEEISDVKVARKTGKVVLKLMKTEEKSWYTLTS